MDFRPILQLELKRAFADCQRFKEIVKDEDLLDVLFEYDNRAQLFICDDAEKGHSVFLPNSMGIGRDKLFVLRNRKHADVFLWHIDGVLFKKDSKCDCAILTDKLLAFVELKSNAVNLSIEAIETNYQKATDQLLQTLNEVDNRCMEVGVSVREKVLVQAFAVFNKSVPRNDAYRKKLSAKFLMISRGVKLKFENETTVL